MIAEDLPPLRQDLPPLRDVIRRHGLSARKSLGQNFLLDLNLTGRIARAAGPLDGAAVIEIGPGPGGLTRALLTEPLDRRWLERARNSTSAEPMCEPVYRQAPLAPATWTALREHPQFQ